MPAHHFSSEVGHDSRSPWSLFHVTTPAVLGRINTAGYQFSHDDPSEAKDGQYSRSCPHVQDGTNLDVAQVLNSGLEISRPVTVWGHQYEYDHTDLSELIWYRRRQYVANGAPVQQLLSPIPHDVHLCPWQRIVSGFQPVHISATPCGEAKAMWFRIWRKVRLGPHL